MTNWIKVIDSGKVYTGRVILDTIDRVTVGVDLLDYHVGMFGEKLYTFPSDYILACHAARIPLDASRAIQ